MYGITKNKNIEYGLPRVVQVHTKKGIIKADIHLQGCVKSHGTYRIRLYQLPDH